MRLPFSARFCSLAAASWLTGACGGQSSIDRSPENGGSSQVSDAGGVAGSSGQPTSGAGTSGTPGGSGGSTLGGSAGSTLGGSAGSGGGDACPVDCSTSPQSCGPCLTWTADSGSCAMSLNGSAQIEGVMFDCAPLTRGDNGFDSQTPYQLLLTGDACEALKTSTPHRIEVVLGCTLDK